MPYFFGFAPFGELSQNIASKLTPGQKVNLSLDSKIVGHINVAKVFKFDESMRAKNIFLALMLSSNLKTLATLMCPTILLSRLRFTFCPGVSLLAIF
ncbi:hypothetical protein [Campylobacter concisus]|uniref:hypothetical protein n=1 Tax=Campylobacter concisus TaxID=199 RepID=UPI0021565ADD|nr:hypothetical protein [Campylobacter concisus]